MWKPINLDHHSIEVMGVTVAFSEPLNSVVYRRILREMERTTEESGLSVRQPISNFEFVVQPGVAASAVPVPTQTNGMIFQRQSPVVLHGQLLENYIHDQVEVQPRSITVRTWRYTRWQRFLEMVKTIGGSSLEMAAQTLAISSIRVEYLDRFYFDGPSDAARPQTLFNDSTEFIARHVLQSKDLWHSHTGVLEPTQDGVKRLSQLNADCVDFQAGPHVGKRTIGLTSAVEDRFGTNGLELDEDPSETIWGCLGSLHEGAKKVLERVLSRDMAVTIGLVNENDQIH